MKNLEDTIKRAKAEVISDVLDGTVPVDVADFSALHDHVDANYYGGAFETAFDASDEACNFWNKVQDAVDTWITSGEMRQEVERRRGGNSGTGA